MRICQTVGPGCISRKENSHCPLHSKDIPHDNPGDSVLSSNINAHEKRVRGFQRTV